MDDEEEFVHFLLLSIFLRLFQTNTNKNQQQQQQTTMMKIKINLFFYWYGIRYLPVPTTTLLLPPMEALLLLVEPGWGAGRVFKKIVDVFFSLNIFAMKHIGSFNVF